MSGDMHVFPDSVPADTTQLLDIYAGAFPDEDLRPLLRGLLDSTPAVISLVARVGERIDGHLALTPCRVAGNDEAFALLGPVAVQPECQRRGIGSALIRRGLEMLRAKGFAGVLVLGDPAYYGRFGFSAPHGIAAPYPIKPEWTTAWQALTLQPGKPLPVGLLAVPDAWMRESLWS